MTTVASRVRRLVLGATYALALVLAGCGDGTTGQEVGTDVGDIVAESSPADAYRGQTVVVSAQVDRVLTPTGFTIGGTEQTALPAVLVVTDEPLVEVDEGETVRITATVRTIEDRDELEQRVGIDLGGLVWDDYEGDPYLQATHVDLSPNYDG